MPLNEKLVHAHQIEFLEEFAFESLNQIIMVRSDILSNDSFN